MSDTLPSVIVIGLGNPILCDDGVGWRVAHEVREYLAGSGELSARVFVNVVEACVGGLSLVELLVGYDQAVVVDAILTEGGVPGSVYQFDLDDLPGTLNTASAHDTNFATALRALRRFGAVLPNNRAISIVAVEAMDVWTFAESCSPAIEAAIPVATAAVVRVIEAVGESERIQP